MHCWSSSSRFTLTVSDEALTGYLEAGATTWLLFLNTKPETLWSVILSRTFCSNCTACVTILPSRECCVAEFNSNGFSLSRNLIILVVSSLPSCCLCVGHLSWNQLMWTSEVLHWFQHMHNWHSEWTTALSTRFSLALQHSFTGLVPVSTPTSMVLSPWSIHIVSWSPSWSSAVSTCKCK